LRTDHEGCFEDTLSVARERQLVLGRLLVRTTPGRPGHRPSGLLKADARTIEFFPILGYEPQQDVLRANLHGAAQQRLRCIAVRVRTRRGFRRGTVASNYAQNTVCKTLGEQPWCPLRRAIGKSHLKVSQLPRLVLREHDRLDCTFSEFFKHGTQTRAPAHDWTAAATAENGRAWARVRSVQWRLSARAKASATS
jgi:hypothetical protein